MSSQQNPQQPAHPIVVKTDYPFLNPSHNVPSREKYYQKIAHDISYHHARASSVVPYGRRTTSNHSSSNLELRRPTSPQHTHSSQSRVASAGRPATTTYLPWRLYDSLHHSPDCFVPQGPQPQLPFAHAIPSHPSLATQFHVLPGGSPTAPVHRTCTFSGHRPNGTVHLAPINHNPARFAHNISYHCAVRSFAPHFPPKTKLKPHPTTTNPSRLALIIFIHLSTHPHCIPNPPHAQAPPHSY